jgi:uncharacterized repeat protein (TIGR03803 family)
MLAAAPIGLMAAAAQTASFNSLYFFQGGSDGRNPNGSLLQSGSMLYGMTEYGGTYGDGTIFSFNLPTVPEPGTLGLLALAGGTLCLRRQRNRAARGDHSLGPPMGDPWTQ